MSFGCIFMSRWMYTKAKDVSRSCPMEDRKYDFKSLSTLMERLHSELVTWNVAQIMDVGKQ